MNKEIKKNKLIKDKYVAMYFGFNVTTFTGWKNKGLSNRVAALKQYYINIINRIDNDTIILYSNNLAKFSEDLKNNIISKKFDNIL
jgi:hypothetical protein